MKLKLAILTLLSAILILPQGCKDSEETPASCAISFKDDIVAITTSTCMGSYCHGSNFSDFATIKAIVDDGALWDKLIVTREMPPDPRAITEEERDMFAQWIECGAPNN